MDLWDALMPPAGRGSLHTWDGRDYTSAPWSEVVSDAREMAGALRQAGVGDGVRVATVLTNTRHAVRGMLAIWLAGGVVASLPLPYGGDDGADYNRRLATIIAALDAPLLLLDADLLGAVSAELRPQVRVRSWESLYGARPADPSPPGRDDVAFIQYSSGSTGTPKGCVLTTRAIAAQLDMVRHLSGGRPGADRGYSWLPLSHDMGTFGCLLYSWAHDYEMMLSTPEHFMRAPRSWFAEMASFGATLTAGTSTAVHLAVRAQRDRPLPGRLALRTCVIGAERVEYDTLERAVATFGPYGLAMRDFVPAYGLAEATLAVTASPVGTEPKAVTLDARRLADGETVDVDAEDPLATWLVSAGPPCPGVRVEVGEPAGPRGPGEPGGPGGAAGTGRVAGIRVSSPCLAEGYFGDSARTRATFDNGWLTTGDLGFLRDGELYVAGRDDDLISMAGRTVSTREIEWSVAALDPVRKGCVVVLDVPMRRRHRLVLMAETKGGVDDFRALAGRAARIAARKAGVTISECVFLRPGTLPKTPSGKVQRFRCRKLLLDECFEPFQHVVLNEEA